MHTLQRHIGIALLGCSFVLFLLWAIPYAGGLDAFSLSASASGDVGLAPEHMQLESQMKTLHKQYAEETDELPRKQAEQALLSTVEHIFEDENPNGELLRGDAAYLATVYAAAFGKPCVGNMTAVLCARIGGATEILDLETVRKHLGDLKDDGTLFQDVAKTDWFSLYIGTLVGLDVLHPDLDAVSSIDGVRRFDPNSPVFAADYERWLYRAQMAEDPKNITTPPGATLTKRQGKDMLRQRLEQAFAARHARR